MRSCPKQFTETNQNMGTDGLLCVKWCNMCCFLTEMTIQRTRSQHNCTDSKKYISINQRTTLHRLHHISTYCLIARIFLLAIVIAIVVNFLKNSFWSKFDNSNQISNFFRYCWNEDYLQYFSSLIHSIYSKLPLFYCFSNRSMRPLPITILRKCLAVLWQRSVIIKKQNDINQLIQLHQLNFNYARSQVLSTYERFSF